MNPLYTAAMGSVIRWALAIGAGYLVERGIWTDAAASTYVAALAAAIVALLWSLYQKYWHRLKLVTAMGLPAGVSEKHVEQVIDSTHVIKPPATIPKDEVVRLLTTTSGAPIPPLPKIPAKE